MDEYKKFLAEQILTEDKVVSYRYLSRALKIHVNTAKQMLYEFHSSQNARKPGSIHATYLVYGSKKVEGPNHHVQEDGDVEMSSSMPEVESISDHVSSLVLSLVKEEQLKDVLSQYEEVTSVHVYSIGPHPMNDLQMLTDAARQVLGLSSGDASAESRKTYGTISNAYVRRRERRGGVPKPAAAPVAAKKQEAKAAPANATASAPIKEEPQEEKAPVGKETSSSVAKKPVPSLKRGGSSGIMQAFAKGAKKKAEDDARMALSDDGEDDSEIVPQSTAAAGRKSRKEREAELQRMMDDDDDEDDEAEEKADTPMEETEEPVEEVPEPEPVKEEPAEVVSASTGDGRRRGRRRVMKKKQVMDDQGYLVTIQEQGWESFSEDEPKPASKPKPASSAPPSQAAKQKKAGPKGSQGNIMSFFSKK